MAWYDREKKYGFIHVQGYNDVFVQWQALYDSGIERPLKPEEPIKFTVGMRGPKPIATDISLKDK